MAIVSADYRLKLKIGHPSSGIPVYNTFYYKRSSGTGTASNLLTSFIDDHMPAIEAVVSENMIGAEVEVQNLLNPDDFAFNGAAGFVGVQTTTEEMPRFVTASFTLFRGSMVQRHHGRKAFGIIAEDSVENGVPTTAYLMVVEAAANTLAATAVTSTTSWRIATPYSIKNTDPMSPDFGKYELDSLFTCPDIAFARISTQNTRKTW